MVSIIVPAYNYGHLIEDTLNSVLAQMLSSWECIIVNDGSTDNTADICKAFASTDDRFHYVAQDNQGLSAARNTGLRKCVGSYIQLLDADDIILPGKLAHQVAFLEANPDVDIVYGDASRFSHSDVQGAPAATWGTDMEWQPRIAEGDDPILVLLRMPPPPHAPLCRRSVFKRVGDFDTKLRACEDWHFWMRCALAGVQFQYISLPDSRVLYRAHARSMVSDNDLMDEWKRKLRSIFQELLPTNQARLLNRRLWAGLEGTIAIRRLRSGNRVAAARACLRGVSLGEGVRQKLKWLACSCAALFMNAERFESFFYGRPRTGSHATEA